METADALAAPLRLPAILQNPVDKTQRRVQAHNAQQRDKAAARRDAARATDITSKRGKKVVRRMNNDNFVDNPHIVAPKRSDMAPAVPLHHHPLRPAFPPEALARNVPVPPADMARADPLGPSAVHGAFSTSLRGTRNLLRRRGRRAESLVPTVEDAVRGWLGGQFGASEDPSWSVIDATGVDPSSSANGSAGPSRHLPPQHQVHDALPALPVSDGTVAAVLELSRSPAHLSWAVPESFDRLVVHLVARYYDLVSWSEDAACVGGGTVRLTHIIRPALVRPRAPHTLLTPETSDVSGVSASDTEHGTETDGDTATEMGDQSDAQSEGDSVEYVETSFQSLSERFGLESEDGLEDDGLEDGLEDDFRGLGLHRTASHGSSAYASSEGGSDVEALAESSLFGPTVGERGLPSPVAASLALPAVNGPSLNGRKPAPQRLTARSDWSDKPTFFEYLFGE